MECVAMLAFVNAQPHHLHQLIHATSPHPPAAPFATAHLKLSRDQIKEHATNQTEGIT